MTTLCSVSKKDDKAILVLVLYDDLLNAKEVVKASFCLEHSVSPRTFDRYIAEIRCFLVEERYDLELVYDWKMESYRIIKTNNDSFR